MRCIRGVTDLDQDRTIFISLRPLAEHGISIENFVRFHRDERLLLDQAAPAIPAFDHGDVLEVALVEHSSFQHVHASAFRAAWTMLAASTPKKWRNAARVSLRPKPSVPRVR